MAESAATPTASCNVVVCQYSVDRLSQPPLVVVEYSAQSFMTLNNQTHVDHTLSRLDQPILEPLMIPLDVIMLRVFLHSVA